MEFPFYSFFVVQGHYMSFVFAKLKIIVSQNKTKATNRQHYVLNHPVYCIINKRIYFFEINHKSF